MLTNEQLDHWQTLADAATPPPWRVCEEGGCRCETVWNTNDDLLVMFPGHFDGDTPCVPEGPRSAANGAFTAAARDAVPLLIAEVRRLREAVKAAIPEIERKAFVAGCVDDSPSQELMRLRRLAAQLKEVLR